MCDQLKGRVAAMQSFGVSEDIVANVSAVIYCSARLDVPELTRLSKIYKG